MTDSQPTKFFISGFFIKLISTKGSVGPKKPIVDSNILNLSKTMLDTN